MSYLVKTSYFYIYMIAANILMRHKYTRIKSVDLEGIYLTRHEYMA